MSDIEQVKREINSICKKNDLLISYRLNFPIYNILPDEVKLAMKILERHGMRISMELEEKK